MWKGKGEGDVAATQVNLSAPSTRARCKDYPCVTDCRCATFGSVAAPHQSPGMVGSQSQAISTHCCSAVMHSLCSEPSSELAKTFSALCCSLRRLIRDPLSFPLSLPKGQACIPIGRVSLTPPAPFPLSLPAESDTLKGLPSRSPSLQLPPTYHSPERRHMALASHRECWVM